LKFTSFHLQIGFGKRLFMGLNSKKPLPVAGKGLESIAIKRTFLGRWVKPVMPCGTCCLKNSLIIIARERAFVNRKSGISLLNSLPMFMGG
jgi:hypothetical protein